MNQPPGAPCVRDCFFRIWLIALTVHFCWQSEALDPQKAVTQYHLDIWTERDGLPQGSVQAILQTRDGYLWIGTRDGLARFDGVTFTTFRAETHPGLVSNDIRALFEDQAGRLWVGTFNGGASYYSKGSFSNLNTYDGLPSNGVYEICADAAGRIWFATRSGLVRLGQDEFEPMGAPQGLSGQNVISMRQNESGELWVLTEQALNRWTGQRFERAIELESASGSREFCRTKNGSWWLATGSSGVSWFDGRQWSTFTTSDGLPDNKIQTILEDADGNVWAGTWRGLARIQKGKVSAFFKQDGLPHDFIEALYEDREGSLWIGTRGGGLARFKDGKFSNYTTREGLGNNFAKCVYSDRSGRIWIGSNGGGLSCFQEGAFRDYTAADGLASDFIWAVEQDAEGSIWVGGAQPAVLARLDRERFTSYERHHGLPVEQGIRAICAEPDGAIWFGGDGGGLGRLKDGRFECLTDKDGLPGAFIRMIAKDRSGNLWVGTTDGLARRESGGFKTFTTKDGLAHNTVYCMFENSTGVLWFGTQGGLSRFENGRFRSYTTREGLFHNVIYQILPDAEENLWMSSNRGIFRLTRTAFAAFDQGKRPRLDSVAFGIADGMKATQCEGANQPAGWKTADGRLWFPTANGVATIDPANIKRNEQAPPVWIEQVVADSRLLAEGDRAALGPGVREFRFHYTALSFLAPEKVRFRYKLEGFDPDWVEAGARRVAFYNELPPGRYRFRVIACNNDDVWNEAGAVWAFYLPPRFYQTAWFYALCIASVAVGAWTFHKRRLRQAEAQFSLVLAERGRIARDLHDTLAQGFAGIAFQLEAVAQKLTEAPSQAQQHLSLALNMVRHSLAEARRSVMNLRSPALEKGDLLEALSESARQMTGLKAVEVEAESSGQKRPLPPALEENLLRVGQEAITNSLKHSGAGKIRIHLEYQRKKIRLRVSDNGAGFDLRRAEAASKETGHFGLLGMQERARQIGGRLHLKSVPGAGTELELEAPLDRP